MKKRIVLLSAVSLLGVITAKAQLSTSVSSAPETCTELNGTASISVSGGTTPYTYAWNPSTQTNTTAKGLSAGTYTVTVLDINGLTATNSVTVAQQSISATITSIGVSCNGGNNGYAAVVASGGTTPYVYSWSPSGQTGANLNEVSAGSYTVTVTDITGCSTTATAVITAPAVLSAITTTIGVSCNGGSNGYAAVVASGGTTPYVYSWSPSGQTSANLNEVSAGTYTVTVTDDKGCVTRATAIITAPAVLSTIITRSECELIANRAGGTAPYRYYWSPGDELTQTISVHNGTYTVRVTDVNGCSASASYAVSTCSAHKPTGVEENSIPTGTGDIVVYPNPSNGQFNLTGLEKGMVIEIYDYTGKKISTLTANDEILQFNLSNQADGIYLIQIFSKNGTLVDKKKILRTN